MFTSIMIGLGFNLIFTLSFSSFIKRERKIENEPYLYRVKSINAQQLGLLFGTK